MPNQGTVVRITELKKLIPFQFRFTVFYKSAVMLSCASCKKNRQKTVRDIMHLIFPILFCGL